jgi:hypothetical protein
MEVLVREQTIPLQTRVEQSTLDDAFVALTGDADAAEAEFGGAGLGESDGDPQSGAR